MHITNSKIISLEFFEKKNQNLLSSWNSMLIFWFIRKWKKQWEKLLLLIYFSAMIEKPIGYLEITYIVIFSYVLFYREQHIHINNVLRKHYFNNYCDILPIVKEKRGEKIDREYPALVLGANLHVQKNDRLK